jgi:7-keto-8-aminopelargonate synthetase-like enzyme
LTVPRDTPVISAISEKAVETFARVVRAVISAIRKIQIAKRVGEFIALDDAHAELAFGSFGRGFGST